MPYLVESMLRTLRGVLAETVDAHYVREEGEHSRGLHRSWPDPRVGSRGYHNLTDRVSFLFQTLQVENACYKTSRQLFVAKNGDYF